MKIITPTDNTIIITEVNLDTHTVVGRINNDLVILTSAGIDKGYRWQKIANTNDGYSAVKGFWMTVSDAMKNFISIPGTKNEFHAFLDYKDALLWLLEN